MQNQSQTKRHKLRLLYILVAALGGLVITGLALFYFYPIPKDLNKIVESGAKVDRCIYGGGVRYKAIFQLESFSGSIFFTIIYNGQGEQICSIGGYSNKPLEEQCKTEMCFPIYGN
ncbi:MAG: hypothetical protein ACD_43C00026G0002 [uncultured bacterium]|nr:MAG: hypothetical protein ACD_43C00026G0002 [uncultured bacterium]